MAAVEQLTFQSPITTQIGLSSSIANSITLYSAINLAGLEGGTMAVDTNLDYAVDTEGNYAWAD